MKVFELIELLERQDQTATVLIPYQDDDYGRVTGLLGDIVFDVEDTRHDVGPIEDLYDHSRTSELSSGAETAICLFS